MTGDKYPRQLDDISDLQTSSKQHFSLNDLGEYEELYDPFSETFTSSDTASEASAEVEEESVEDEDQSYELTIESDALPPTISREKEVSIAIRLENAEIEIMHHLLATPFGTVRLLEVADKVRAGKLKLSETLRDYKVEYADRPPKQVEKEFFALMAKIRQHQISIIEINRKCHDSEGIDASEFQALLAKRKTIQTELHELLNTVYLSRKQCQILYYAYKDLYRQLEEARDIIREAEQITGAGYREIERLSRAITDGELPPSISHNTLSRELDYVTINETVQNAIDTIRGLEISFHSSADSLLALHDSLIVPVRALKQAKDEFFAANQRLVVHIAQKYDTTLDLQDLIQEGGFGLLKAIDRFEYRRKNRFATYATWWIRQAISRAIVDFSRTVRLPNHADAQLRLLVTKTLELSTTLGRNPTLDELADYVEQPVKVIEQLLPFIHTPESLDTVLNSEESQYSPENAFYDEKDNKTVKLKDEIAPELIDFTTDNDGYYTPDAEITIGDTLLDTQVATPLDEILNQELIDQINEVESNLTEREKAVLNLRYGLNGELEHTLEEIGQMFNLTRERIRQIEENAIHKLQHPVRISRLRSYNEK